MADNGSSNTGMVAILVIFVIVVALGFFAWQGGMLGGGGSDTDVDVDLNAPAAVDKPADNPPG